MFRWLAIAFIAAPLSGCAAAAGLGVAAGIAAGVAGLVNNGRQIVRANMDARCNEWFATKNAWYLGYRLTKGDLDKANFDIMKTQNDTYCLHAWTLPGAAADEMVVRNSAAVQDMIAGIAP